MLAFLLILGAVSSYYQDTLGTTIDRDMVQSALTTTRTEAKHLITAPFLIHVQMFGILPALVVAAIPVRREGQVRDCGMGGCSRAFIWP